MLPRRLGSLTALVSAVLLGACGGGGTSDDHSPSNPAAGIFSGTDSFGNPASILITPNGQYQSVVFLKSTPMDLYSASTAEGQLTPYVLASSRLSTFDVQVGVLVAGSLSVEYTEGVRVRADLSYPFGTRTIAAPFLPGSRSSSSNAGIPPAGEVVVYAPVANGPALSTKGTWTFSPSQGTFSIAAGACVLEGRSTSELGINAVVLAVKPTEACGNSGEARSGYAWYDSARATAYAVLTKTGTQVSSPPLVLVIRG